MEHSQVSLVVPDSRGFPAAAAPRPSPEAIFAQHLKQSPITQQLNLRIAAESARSGQPRRVLPTPAAIAAAAAAANSNAIPPSRQPFLTANTEQHADGENASTQVDSAVQALASMSGSVAAASAAHGHEQENSPAAPEPALAVPAPAAAAHHDQPAAHFVSASQSEAPAAPPAAVAAGGLQPRSLGPELQLIKKRSTQGDGKIDAASAHIFTLYLSQADFNNFHGGKKKQASLEHLQMLYGPRRHSVQQQQQSAGQARRPGNVVITVNLSGNALTNAVHTRYKRRACEDRPMTCLTDMWDVCSVLCCVLLHQEVYAVILEHIADKLTDTKATLASLHKYRETVRKSISRTQAARHDSPKLAARLKGRQKAVRSHVHLSVAAHLADRSRLACFDLCVTWQKRVRRKKIFEQKSRSAEGGSDFCARAVKVHEDGLQLLDILCGEQGACFHSEDEDVPLPDGSLAKRTRAHAFRSALADQLLALLGTCGVGVGVDTGAAGVHRVSATMARMLLDRKVLHPLVRAEVLEAAATQKPTAVSALSADARVSSRLPAQQLHHEGSGAAAAVQAGFGGGSAAAAAGSSPLPQAQYLQVRTHMHTLTCTPTHTHTHTHSY
jgi:hypothetical protein